jgi:hypothetical protein
VDASHWLIFVPIAAELLWAATYVRRFRRWRKARDEVARRLGRPINPDADFEHLLVYTEVILQTPRRSGNGVDQADADDLWAKGYMLYHLPALLLLRLTGRPASFPLLAFDARAAVTMAGTAAGHAVVCYLIGSKLAA